MKTFSSSELKFMENLVGLSQDSLKNVLYKFLCKYYKKVVYDQDFIYAIGDIPIALVAHMDTVFPSPAKEVFYDKRKNVLFSPSGLGADDRAGIFAITYIIQTTKFRPHIIFTTDEEIGGIGAEELSYIDCPFSDLKYIIELDRRGANDCVFYDCENPNFETYVEAFGFVTNYGTFSDISLICPKWGIAGVNLSIGYRDEHTVSEILFVGHMFNTIEKVKKMLALSDTAPVFKYIPAIPKFNFGLYDNYYSHSYYHKNAGIRYKCKGCGKIYSEDAVMPVKLIKGGVGFFCENCLISRVDWCRSCGEAFQIDPKNPTKEFCTDCGKKIKKIKGDK